MSAMAAPYVNAGNTLVLSMMPEGVGRVLDVGCGARHRHDMIPAIKVMGLTHSVEETSNAALDMESVHVIDLEQGLTLIERRGRGSGPLSRRGGLVPPSTGQANAATLIFTPVRR